MADSKKVILEGDAAVDLWLQGKEAWNDWVAQHPIADIDFSNVDFSQVEYGKYTVDDAPSERKMSFMDYKFPRGDVSFYGAAFGDGDVSFYGATFGDGDVSFGEATFGDGDVWFGEATFGDGDVSFYGATFGDGDVWFVNATFGDGDVSFYGATFGDGDVWFVNATFGDGDVSFGGATFGDGDVSFGEATFGDGDVWFVKATFGDGDVSFGGATFGDGDVSFGEATFGDGDVWFGEATFGDGNVSFVNATFGDGDVSFGGATFGDGDVSFYGAKFGDGDVSFDHATFGDGDVSFDYAKFGDGNVSFTDATFGDGDVSFDHATFGKGNVGFDALQNVGKVKKFSFQGCTIDSQFTISSSERFGVPIDLTHTKYSHQILLSEVSCDFRAQLKKWFGQRKIAENSLDSQRFRRLKEIALSNRNNAKAMEFHIGEIQSQRGHGTNIITDVAEWLFWLLGDYGRSVLRPLIGLGVNMFLFAIIFYDLRTIFKAQAWESFFTALTYSGSQMLAFIPISRTAGSRGEEILFGKATPNIVIILGATESIISIILLFLLGLGLRNMFRV